MPPAGTGIAHAAHAALRSGRLQLPASGPVRQDRVSFSSGPVSLLAGTRLYLGLVSPGGESAASPGDGPSDSPAAGRGPRDRHAPPAGEGQARLAPDRHAA